MSEYRGTEAVRVLHWGLGAMGGAMVRLVSRRSLLVSVGAIDSDPGKVGRDLGEVVGLSARTGVSVLSDPERALLHARPDVTLIATGSFVPEVWPQIRQAVEAGSNVICIAEEMAYPWAGHPDLAERMDELARAHGVTVLGTGINPGFVLDTLIVALTGVCQEVESIRAARINDLSPFGPTVMRTQGVGTTPEEFARGLETGTIVGHVGFPESMLLIARALGWDLDEVEENREPIISQTERETPHVKMRPGQVAGCRHTAVAKVGGRVVIELEHPQQIHPHLEGVETGDYIEIRGVPNISLAIKPEIPGGIGTVAIAVNMIEPVVRSGPGLKTMADMPVPRCLVKELAPV